jgi:translation initiation factor 3 subunit K
LVPDLNLPLLSIRYSFQFNPQEFDYNVVVSILFKALTGAPHPDFNLCLSLLGEAPVSILSTAAPVIPEDATDEQKAAIQKESADAATAPSAGSLTDPMFVKLAALSSLLLSARFRQFWKTWESSEYSDARSFAKSVHGFEDSVRWVALDTVKGAFRTIGKTRLAGYLNMPGESGRGKLRSSAGAERSHRTKRTLQRQARSNSNSCAPFPCSFRSCFLC